MSKNRSDKWEDRINTTTKYLFYSLFSLIAWLSLAFAYSPIEIQKEIVRDTKIVYKTKYISCKDMIKFDDSEVCTWKCIK